MQPVCSYWHHVLGAGNSLGVCTDVLQEKLESASINIYVYMYKSKQAFLPERHYETGRHSGTELKTLFPLFFWRWFK